EARFDPKRFVVCALSRVNLVAKQPSRSVTVTRLRANFSATALGNRYCGDIRRKRRKRLDKRIRNLLLKRSALACARADEAPLVDFELDSGVARVGKFAAQIRRKT